MDSKKFKLWNRICAALAFVVSAVTYLLTIEPSVSFWDCGEFIASSYKLEVGHPPGNPVFQLFARLVTMFGDNAHAAILVNALSAICSAATIFFLYLTIVWLAKRLLRPAADASYSLAQAAGLYFLRHLLVFRRRGRGLCDVLAVHGPGLLADDGLVRPRR